jgi:two-component system sensor histidine kinase RegB
MVYANDASIKVMETVHDSMRITAAPRDEGTNLHWLVLLRWCVLLLALGAILGAYFLVGEDLPLAPLLLTLGVLAGVNAATWARLQKRADIRPGEMLAQLLVDLVGLTVLLYFSGGWSNPFVFILLLPLAIAAAEGSGRRALWVLLAAIVAYSFLALTADPEVVRAHHGALLLPLLGMWTCYVLSAGLITFFVLKTSRALLQKERELALARERELRDQNLVELATMATGAAHELGTPLGTMAVLLGDLQQRYQDDDELHPELELLRGQVYRCKEILGRLTRDAGEQPADAGAGQRLDAYLQDLVDAWHAERPQVRFTYRYSGLRPGPRILIDETLTQTVLNLLNNAAEASAREVELRAQCDAEALELTISDRGPGIPADLLGVLGRRPLPNRGESNGLGIGVYLAAATLERLGGRLMLSNREGGGAISRIQLPLAPLKLESGALEDVHA